VLRFYVKSVCKNIDYSVSELVCMVLTGVISDDELKDDLAGSTANIVLIKDNKIYCVRWCCLFLLDVFLCKDLILHFICTVLIGALVWSEALRVSEINTVYTAQLLFCFSYDELVIINRL